MCIYMFEAMASGFEFENVRSYPGRGCSACKKSINIENMVVYRAMLNNTQSHGTNKLNKFSFQSSTSLTFAIKVKTSNLVA